MEWTYIFAATAADKCNLCSFCPHTHMNNLYKKSVKLKNNNNNKTVLFCYLSIHKLIEQTF